MANFCGFCGSRLDSATGLCPNCNKEEPVADIPVQETAPPACEEPIIVVQEPVVAAQEPVVAAQEPVAPAEEAPTVAPQSVAYPQDVILVADPAPVAELPAEGQTGKKAKKEKPPKKEKQPKQQKKKGSGGGLTVFVSILGAICLLVTSVCALAIYDVRGAVSSEQAQNLLNNVEVMDLVSVAGVDMEQDMQKLTDHLKKEYNVEVSQKDIEKFIEKSTIKDFAADKAATFVADFYEGDAELSITKEEVIGLLEANRKIINKEFDANLKEKDIEQVADWVFESEDEDAEISLLHSDDIKEKNAGVYYAANLGLSYMMMWIFVVLSLLTVFLLLRNSLTQGMLSVGIVFIIVGGLNMLASAIVIWVDVLWEGIVGGSTIGMMVGNVLAAGLVPAACVLGVGIVLLAVRSIIVRVRKKKAAV